MSGEAGVGLGPLRGRRVLVTGHTGFKGGWLAAWLLELGADVVGFALDPEGEPRLFDALDLGSRLDDRRGDVRDAAAVRRVVGEVRPDAVFHLAAQALVRRSYDEPEVTFATNVMGTVHLLEAIRLEGRPCAVVVVTSDKCYENIGSGRPFREDDPLGGHDPYSASKGAAEIAAAAYRRSFFPAERLARHGVAVATVRAGNVIGGGDWARDRIVPDIVRALLAGRPVVLRNPAAVRPWQHVLDALSGYLWIAARMLDERAPELASAWNFGPPMGEAVPVSVLTDRVLEAWGAGRWIDGSEAGARHEAGFLALDTERAAARLDWTPTWRVSRAIEATVAWYKESVGGGSMRAFTAGQIGAYTAAARDAGLRWARTEP